MKMPRLSLDYIMRLLRAELLLLAGTAALAYFLGKRGWYDIAESLTWVGFAAIIVGVSAPLGNWAQTRGYWYSMATSASHERSADRIRRENQDLESSYRTMFFWMFAGLGLVGIAALIHQFVLPL